MNLQELMSKPANKGDQKSGKKRYTDYVIETQEQGEEPLPFAEWYKLNQ